MQKSFLLQYHALLLGIVLLLQMIVFRPYIRFIEFKDRIFDHIYMKNINIYNTKGIQPEN